MAGPSSKTECLELVDSEEDEEEEEEQEEEDDEIRQPKLNTFKEAIESIENVTAFLDFRGFTALASDASQLKTLWFHFILNFPKQGSPLWMNSFTNTVRTAHIMRHTTLLWVNVTLLIQDTSLIRTFCGCPNGVLIIEVPL